MTHGKERKTYMTAAEALEKLLKSYRQFYNVERENVTEPFAAEAVFHSHDEQYFLVKSARLSETESNEYVFFAVEDALVLPRVQLLEDRAWETGLSRVKPHSSHKNSDVVLIMLADHIAADAAEYIKKTKRSKSYRYSLQGWSSFYVVAMETSTGTLCFNKRGSALKKLFRNIK